MPPEGRPTRPGSTYAPDLEQFWSSLPFAGAAQAARPRRASPTTSSAAGRPRTSARSPSATTRLGLQASIFNGYPGLRGAKWKEGLLDAATDSAELGPQLGAPRRASWRPTGTRPSIAWTRSTTWSPALKEAVEKVAESELVLILEPVPAPARASEAADLHGRGGGRRGQGGGLGPGQIRLPDRPGGRARGIGLVETDQGSSRTRRATTDSSISSPPGPPRPPTPRSSGDPRRSAHPDPVGLGLAPKGDPLAAIEALRKLDSAAKPA